MMSGAGGGQATPPPPPTPPTPTDSSGDENEDSADDVIDAAINTKFMADTKHEAKEEQAAHAAFDAEQKSRREAVAAEEELDDGDFDWSRPDSEEKVAE
jgi:hypothetical protein